MCESYIHGLLFNTLDVHAVQGWPLETLRKYLHWAKCTFQPVLSSEAEALLTGFYQSQRRLADRSKALTTIRMLEGLIRIAQVRFWGVDFQSLQII